MQNVNYSLIQNQRQQQMYVPNQNAVQNQHLKSTQNQVESSKVNRLDLEFEN